MFDFTKEPGKQRTPIAYTSKKSPTISVIVPFYNDFFHIEQTIYAILNQTYPLFELLVIDDGSTDEKSLQLLDQIVSLDQRIKLFHKENTGVSDTRDYGAKKASKSTKYLVFCDSDDLLEPTYLECCYWSLETNQEAAWAYSNSVGFEGMEYEWNCHFDSEVMKYENILALNSMIRKNAFWSVNGFGLKKKKMYEDWNLWLKLLGEGFFPIHIADYGCWYRRKKEGELSSTKKENHKKAFSIVKQSAKKITKKVEAIEYPRYQNLSIQDPFFTDFSYKIQFDKIYLVPHLDEKSISYYNHLAEKERLILVLTMPELELLRQKLIPDIQVFNLSSFLDQSYWNSFLGYLKKTRHVKEIVGSLELCMDDESVFKEKCKEYFMKNRYPREISIFKRHYKYYQIKVKLDDWSRKHHCYSINLWIQKRIFNLLKRLKREE